MLPFINPSWLPLALLASFGASGVLGDCAPPENLADNLRFNKRDNSGLFDLSCVDVHLTLVPILSSANVQCEDDKWVMSSALPGGGKVELAKMKCVHMCMEPLTDHGMWIIDSKDNEQLATNNMGKFASKTNGQVYFIPGVKINLTCAIGYSPRSVLGQCGDDGQWTPPMTCSNTATSAENIESDVSPDPTTTTIIVVSVVAVSVVSFIIIVLVIVLRAKRRGGCRKRRAPASHPDDSNYPIGYTQLGPALPSYADALEEDDNYRSSTAHPEIYSVYRPTTTTSDYRQLSSLETSSRGESESLSAGSHRHSLFSGTSSNYRNVVGGDNLSDILVQGDHLSMSDTSTLVTVNTYESNRSLTNSRRGIAGSMVSNTATSMDDAPLIVRRNDQDLADNHTHNNNVES